MPLSLGGAVFLGTSDKNGIICATGLANSLEQWDVLTKQSVLYLTSFLNNLITQVSTGQLNLAINNHHQTLSRTNQTQIKEVIFFSLFKVFSIHG